MSCKLRCHLYSEEECMNGCRYAMQLAQEIDLVKEARSVRDAQRAYGFAYGFGQGGDYDAMNWVE